MTTDINSIRNNLLDFIVKREYQVNKNILDDIGSSKDKDLFLYLYLNKRKDSAYILSSKQQRALNKLNSLYKDDKYNNILLSEFYTSFKSIYDIVKNYKENNDIDDRKIENLANNFKKLYLLYNKDIDDDFKNDNKVFNYIENNITKFKGGYDLNNYKKFVSLSIKENEKNEEDNNDEDEYSKLIDKNMEINDMDIKMKDLNAKLKKENQIKARKNMNILSLFMKNSSIDGVDKEADVASRPPSPRGDVNAVASGDASGNSLYNSNSAASAVAAVSGDDVSGDDPAVAAAASVVLAAAGKSPYNPNSTIRSVSGDASDAAPAAPAVAAVAAVAAELKGGNNIIYKGGGTDTDIIKKDIIENLNEYKEELSNIDTKTSKIINDTTSNITSNIISNIDLYDNSSNEKDFNKYEKNIDDLKDKKNELEEYFKKINTIYNDINISIKGIDTEVLKDILLKKYIKEFNKFSLNDIDINIKIKEYNKLINEYPKNKEKYDKNIKKKEEIEKHERAVKLETVKAEGIKEMLFKRGGSGEGTDSKNEKKLKDLIDILNKIINILKNKIPSSNNGDNNIDIDSSLFEKIWSQYVKYENDVKLDLKPNRTLMDAEDDFYDQINMNDLNPVDVLEINSKDKYVFCALIFFIRLFIVVIINLLIENNIIKSLDTALIIYVFAYVLIIIIIAIVVNMDTYKLRILLNYFNMNMNINLLILHVFIVIVFFILILIIVFDNENDKNKNIFNSIFDFSYVYNILWNLFIGKINQENAKDCIINTNISTNQKLKIQYKFEILTMIVYMFSAAIILIL